MPQDLRAPSLPDIAGSGISSPLNCPPSRTYSAGQPHDGLCPKFPVTCYFSIAIMQFATSFSIIVFLFELLCLVWVISGAGVYFVLVLSCSVNESVVYMFALCGFVRLRVVHADVTFNLVCITCSPVVCADLVTNSASR